MMDTVRKVTSEFDREFERWINRTKKFNGFPPYTDSRKKHWIVRRTLMNILSKKIQLEPPIKIPKGFKAPYSRVPYKKPKI